MPDTLPTPEETHNSLLDTFSDRAVAVGHPEINEGINGKQNPDFGPLTQAGITEPSVYTGTRKKGLYVPKQEGQEHAIEMPGPGFRGDQSVADYTTKAGKHYRRIMKQAYPELDDKALDAGQVSFQTDLFHRVRQSVLNRVEEAANTAPPQLGDLPERLMPFGAWAYGKINSDTVQQSRDNWNGLGAGRIDYVRLGKMQSDLAKEKNYGTLEKAREIGINIVPTAGEYAFGAGAAKAAMPAALGAMGGAGGWGARTAFTGLGATAVGAAAQGGPQVLSGEKNPEALKWDKLKSDAISNLVFAGLDPLKLSSAKSVLARAGEGIARGEGTMQINQQLQHWAGGAENNSSLWRMAFGNEDERKEGWNDFKAELTAIGGIEGAMNLHGMVSQAKVGERINGLEASDPELKKALKEYSDEAHPYPGVQPSPEAPMPQRPMTFQEAQARRRAGQFAPASDADLLNQILENQNANAVNAPAAGAQPGAATRPAQVSPGTLPSPTAAGGRPALTPGGAEVPGQTQAPQGAALRRRTGGGRQVTQVTQPRISPQPVQGEAGAANRPAAGAERQPSVGAAGQPANAGAEAVPAAESSILKGTSFEGWKPNEVEDLYRQMGLKGDKSLAAKAGRLVAGLGDAAIQKMTEAKNAPPPAEPAKPQTVHMHEAQAEAAKAAPGIARAEDAHWETYPEARASMTDDQLREAKQRGPLEAPPHGDVPESHFQKAWDTVSSLWPEMAGKVKKIAWLNKENQRSTVNAGMTNTGELWLHPDKTLTPETLWHELVHVEQSEQGRRAPLADRTREQHLEMEREAVARAAQMGSGRADGKPGADVFRRFETLDKGPEVSGGAKPRASSKLTTEESEQPPSQETIARARALYISGHGKEHIKKAFGLDDKTLDDVIRGKYGRGGFAQEPSGEESEQSPAMATRKALIDYGFSPGDVAHHEKDAAGMIENLGPGQKWSTSLENFVQSFESGTDENNPQIANEQAMWRKHLQNMVAENTPTGQELTSEAKPRPSVAELNKLQKAWEEKQVSGGGKKSLAKRIREFQKSPEFQAMTEQEQEKAIRDMGAGKGFNAGKHQLAPGEMIRAQIQGIQKKKGVNAPDVELEERFRTNTRLANQDADEELQERGKPPLNFVAKNATTQQVWDEAMNKVQNDPSIGERLVNELHQNMRPVSREEGAILLHRKIHVENEYDKADIALDKASKDPATSLGEMTSFEERKAGLENEFDKTLDVIKRTGTDQALAFQFRQALAEKDYSKIGLLRRFRNIKGKPLTPEEENEILRLREKVQTLQDQYDSALKGAQEAKQPEAAGDPYAAIAASIKVPSGGARSLPGQKQLIALERGKGEIETLADKYKASNLPAAETAMRTVTDFWRFLKLTNPATLIKIGASSLSGMAAGTAREAAGSVLKRLPILADIMAGAPSRGGGLDLSKEAQAHRSGWVEGLKDAWDKMKTGDSDLDVLAKQLGIRKNYGGEMYGQGQTSKLQTALDIPGRLHGALKAPLMREAYTRSMLNRIESNAKNGVEQNAYQDLQDMKGALNDGYREIFQEDNAVTKAFNNSLSSVTRNLKSQGVHPGLAYVPEAIGHALVPFTRTPANIVKQAITDYLGGLPIGLTRAAVAKGTGQLTPLQADSIARQLKNGVVGGAMVGLGFYLGPKVVGSLYQMGQKKEDETDIPQITMHHSLMQVMQIGATTRKNMETKVKGASPGALSSAFHSVMDEATEDPYYRAGKELVQLGSPREQGYAFGEMARGFTVPALLDWLARTTDTEGGKEVKRKPTTTLQHIETGIPGLRQQVPKKVSGGSR